jgi:hypothetical protein
MQAAAAAVPRPAHDAGAPQSKNTRQALSQACQALWLATLSLMTAFMQTQAPAHRYLLARRIAANLHTLTGQDSFAPPTRERFERLARRWEGVAVHYHPEQQVRPAEGLLAALRRLARELG